ncbi:MAG: type II secretion system protein GspD, partial [Pseudanabaena sp.]
AQLARLDIRKRQVVINVRVVEINLNSGTPQPNQTVTGNIAFTGGNPTITTAGNVLGLSLTSAAPITLPNSLLATITASVTSGQGKVLTDPSLTVQEGENASISLTEKVVTENTITTTPPTGGAPTGTITQVIKTEDVGLSLNISLARVDDNGFINLSISPSVTAIIGQTDLGGSNPDLAGSFASIVSKRTLNSGQIRLRDGQTLILSGIIRDSERQATAKVPILGDIPILGALFRSETTTSNRSEVVIVVTPRIIDDSQNANWGYTYQPGPEAQKVIDSNQRKAQ